MTYFAWFFLDKEKDIIVNLYKDLDRMYYCLKTPNHASGNLIRNIAKICDLELTKDENDMLVIKGEVPCFIDGNNKENYIFKFQDTEIARIFPDGRVEVKATIPAIAKTLMSQSKEALLPLDKTLFETFIRKDLKFRADLHTHMNGNLTGDVLIALGIAHQIRYQLYYVKKLELTSSKSNGEK